MPRSWLCWPRPSRTNASLAGSRSGSRRSTRSTRRRQSPSAPRNWFGKDERNEIERSKRLSAVLDASAAVRALADRDSHALGWFIALENAGVRAVVPDLFFVEVANSFARLIRAAQLKHEDAHAHLELLRLLPLDVRPLGELAAPATAMALARSLTVYDACYALLAEVEGAVLVTADRALAGAVARSELV